MIVPRHQYRTLLCLLLLLALRGAWAFTVTQQGSQLLVDGRPTALTFAWNCKDAKLLPLYREFGFNTVMIRVDSLGVEALEQAKALAEAAVEAKLFVLVELANGGWSSGMRVNIADSKYQESVKYYLDEVIPRFQSCPNLIGWVISTPEDRLLVSNSGTFADFLRQKYGTLANLNAHWSTTTNDGSSPRRYTSRIASFEILTEKTVQSLVGSEPSVRKLVNEDIVSFKQGVTASDSDFQQYLHTRYATLEMLNNRWDFKFAKWEDIHIATVLKRQEVKPGSSPQSLLELARYQALYGTLAMSWWGRQVTEHDNTHLLFAGNQQSYRSLVGLPEDINGVVTACFPGVAEVDRESHNPQAIDIARHGNRFIVLAGLQIGDSAPNQFGNYLYGAALHGAAGIGVDDWPALASSDAHARVVQAALADLANRRILGRVPAPSVAIVYSPYSVGAFGVNRSLYGYTSGVGYYGTGMLFFNFRGGSRFGQFDYLSSHDLSSLNLSRYRTILLPSVFDLPDSAQEALAKYVNDGGTILADIGVATLQADNSFYALPPRLMALFGLMNAPGLREVRYNLEVYRQYADFPHLLQGLRTNGLAAGYAVTHAALMIPVQDTDLLFQAVATREITPPVPRPYRPLEHKPTCGMFISKRGKGLALYASFPLYQNWMPGNMLFEEFHNDLFARGAFLQLERPIDLLPPLAEVAAFADGSAAVWTKDQTAPVVQLRNPVRQVFATGKGICEINPESTMLRFSTAGFYLIEPQPIFLDAAPFKISTGGVQSSDLGIVFMLGADDDNAKRMVTMRVSTGIYVVKPNSKHLVAIATDGSWQDQTVQADGKGWLTITAPARSAIRITGTDPIINIERPETPAPGEGGEAHIELDTTPPRQEQP